MGCAVIDCENPANLASLDARREFRSLEDWVLSEDALSQPISVVEAEQMKRSREVNRLLLQAHIRARGTGEMGPKLEVVVGGGDDKVVFLRGKIRERELQSVFGTVEVERRTYSLEGHCSVVPLDLKMGLPLRSFSYEVQRYIVRGAVQGPFDEAAASVREFTGLAIPKRSAEDIVVEAAVDFEAFYQQRQVPGAEHTGPILVAAADGKGVPMKKPEPAEPVARRKKGEKANKKRMATVAAVYTVEPRIRTPEQVVESLFRADLKVVGKDEAEVKKRSRPQNKRVWASLPKGKDGVLDEVQEEMERRDPDKTKTRVGLTDGDPALQKRVLKRLLGVMLILDLLHALGYLWKAVYVFHKEGSQEAEDWVRKYCLMILRGQLRQVIRGLRQTATEHGVTGKAREPIDKAIAYFYRNRHYMRYDQYLERGLPIASGAVEGACKNLVKDRMERSGMRWTERSAEAMLKLRAVYLSGDFDAYWAFHIAQDLSRRRAEQGQKLPDRHAAK